MKFSSFLHMMFRVGASAPAPIPHCQPLPNPYPQVSNPEAHAAYDQCMALPTDVIDHILGFLQSDPISLKTCSQSHPILSNVAERHLSSSITVVDDNNTDIVSNENCLPVQDLSETLSNKPHIANYIRNLKVICSWTTSSSTSYWETISLILPLLLSLRELTVSCRHRPSLWGVIPQMPTKFRIYLHLLDPIRLPSMPKIRIENLILDHPSLHLCQRFKFLTLSYCRYSTNWNIPTLDHPSSPPCQSLSIEHCTEETLYNIVPWVRKLSLRSLRLFDSIPDSIPDRSATFLRLLSGCSTSLNGLDLDFERNGRTRYMFTMNNREIAPEVSSFLSLSFPCLERLIFRAKIDLNRQSDPGCPWALFAPLPRMLQLIKSSPFLKYLFLDLRFRFSMCRSRECVCTAKSLPCADVIWFPLLSLANACLSLSSIRIYVFMRYDRGDFTCNLEVILPSLADCSRLMQFVEKGVVVIQPRDWNRADLDDLPIEMLPPGSSVSN